MRKRTNRELSLVLASLRRGWARRCYFAIHCAGAAGRRGTGTSAACCVRPDVDCFYFGCIDGPGHFFHGQARSCRDVRELEDRLRLLFAGLDGTLCWNSPRSERDRYARRDEAEGRAFVTHRGGWTALAFWDRSVDRRGACNSAFFVQGTLTFAQIVRVARHRWPKIWARFAFPVVEVDAQGREVAHG